MATTHVISTSNPAQHLSSTGSHSSSSSNIVGVHYKVGKKIGEGSFGVIFEGERSVELGPWRYFGSPWIRISAGSLVYSTEHDECEADSFRSQGQISSTPKRSPSNS